MINREVFYCTSFCFEKLIFYSITNLCVLLLCFAPSKFFRWSWEQSLFCCVSRTDSRKVIWSLLGKFLQKNRQMILWLHFCNQWWELPVTAVGFMYEIGSIAWNQAFHSVLNSVQSAARLLAELFSHFITWQELDFQSSSKARDSDFYEAW